MKDRVPTQVVNGAVRMAQYNASGTFTGYIYLKRADEPSEPGTPYNKNNVLTDATSAALGLTSDNPTPNDAFARIAARFGKVEPVKNVTQLANTTASEDNEAVDVALPKVIGQYSKLYINAPGAYCFYLGDTTAAGDYACVDIYSSSAIVTSYRYDPTDMMMYTDVHMLYVTDLDYNYIGVDNSRAAVPIQIYGVEAAT